MQPQLLLLFAIALAPALAARDCPTFCANMSATCTGANTQYPMPDDNDFCLNTCMYSPLGDPADTSNDTYYCRVYHLGVANTTGPKNTHCFHAGFDGGDGVCGYYCEAYCDTVMNACIGTNMVQAYSDMTACMNECMFFPAANPPINLASAAASSGNTRDCRMWHAQFALGLSSGQATDHCNHAAPQSYQNQCGTMCDNYCTVNTQVCTGNLAQWNNKAQCMTACLAFPQTPTMGTSAVPTSGDSVGCRKYHAMAAYSLDDRNTHCPHSGPLGGGVCGTGSSGCDGYCDLALAMCKTEYTDTTDCHNKCATWTWYMNSTKAILGGTGLVPDSLDMRTCAVLNGHCGAVKDGLKCSGATAIQAAWSLLAFLVISLALIL